MDNKLNKITEKTFKISDLEKIDLKDLDGCDSFLISDRDPKTSKWFTKRLTIQQMLEFLTARDKTITNLVNDIILRQTKADGAIGKAVSSQINTALKAGGAIESTIQRDIAAALSTIDAGEAFQPKI